MEPVKPRICIDFDGTIYDGKGLFPGCVEVITELRKTWRVAVFSARGTDPERDQMIRILSENDVPVDEILRGKPEADFYLDDKARQFVGWEHVLKQVGK